MIKRILLAIAAMAAMAPLVFGASFEVQLAWDANTERDMKEYRIYRTDGSRELQVTVAHPVTTVGVPIFVADGSEGVVKFRATAVDLAGNESGDSNEVSRPFDYRAPAAPVNLR